MNTRLLAVCIRGISAVVCAGASFLLYCSLQAQKYVLGDAWLTTGTGFLCAMSMLGVVFGMFWYVRQWRYVKWFVLLQGIVACTLLVITRLCWTTDTFIGTPWIESPEIVAAWMGGCIAALTLSVAIVTEFLVQKKNTTTDAEKRSRQKKYSGLTTTKKSWIHTACLTVIILFGIWQASYYMPGEQWNLQNDEFLQYSAAVGHNRTGEFVRWDFTKNAPELDAAGQRVIYDRASVSTWQMAMSMRMFGETEWAARFPALLWFIALLGIVYVTVFRCSQQSFVSASAAALSFTFFNGVLMHAQMVRMYSPLLTLTTLIVIGFWYAYQYYIRGEWLRWAIASALTAIATVLAWMHQELALLILPGMIIFVAAEWLRFCIQHTVWPKIKHKKPSVTKAELQAQKYRMIGLLTAVVTVVGVWLLNEALHSAIFTLGHLGFRSVLNTEYEFLGMMDFSLPLIVMALYLVAVLYFVFFSRSTPKERYVAIVSLSVILILLLVVKRYKAYRYIQFVLPVIFAVLWLYWFRVVRAAEVLWHKMIPHKKSNKNFTAVIASISFVLFFVPIGIAGVKSFPPFLMPIQPADATYMDQHGFHTADVYQFIRAYKQSNEAFMPLMFRDLYWGTDMELNLHPITRQKTYTVTQLRADVETSPIKEGWFVWENAKTKELQPEVLRYLATYGQFLTRCTPELDRSGMQVVFLGARQIPCENATYASEWAAQTKIIAHGMGGVNGVARSNTKEAFEETVQNGGTVIEADFSVTKDKKVVMKHDWNAVNAAGKKIEKPLPYAEFMSTKVEGKYTPVDVYEMVKLLADNPHVSLVTDIKGSNFEFVLTTLKREIEKQDPRIFSQIIIQIYHPENIIAAQQFSNQSTLLFTLYLTTLTDDEVVRFVQHKKIPIVTISTERFSKEFAQKLKDVGAQIYVHTVNSEKTFQQLQEDGARGVYSDDLKQRDY